MLDIEWIRIKTNMFNDEKIKLIEKMPDADTLLIIWVKLICQAGKVNDNGAIYLSPEIPYTTEDLATVFNRPLNTVRLALETFRRLGMIAINETGVIILINWAKNQNVDALEKIRIDTRNRVEKYRASQKLISLGSVNVTLRNELEVEKEVYIEEEKKKEILLQKVKEGRLRDIVIGSETLFSMLQCLKGERECSKVNLRMYRMQIEKLGLNVDELISGDQWPLLTP